ncbi:MAG: hypothetical protein RLP14_01975 [Owenweeksia sp.]
MKKSLSPSLPDEWDWRDKLDSIDYGVLDYLIHATIKMEPINTRALVTHYNQATPEERYSMDLTLISLTGGSLTELMKYSQK